MVRALLLRKSENSNLNFRFANLNLNLHLNLNFQKPPLARTRGTLEFEQEGANSRLAEGSQNRRFCVPTELRSARRELPFAVRNEVPVPDTSFRVSERLPLKGVYRFEAKVSEAKVRQFVEQERSFWLCYPKLGTIRKQYGPYFRSRAVGRSVAVLSYAEQVRSQSL